MTKVIYFTPNIFSVLGDDFDIKIKDVMHMSSEDAIDFARNCCVGEAEIYTLSEFEFAFNTEGISDMGYIVFV